MDKYVKAVLEIANSSAAVQRVLLPILDTKTETIHWNKLGTGLSRGQHAAVAWAKAIWTGETDKDMIDIFEAFGTLDEPIQKAILNAMKIRFDIDQDSEKQPKAKQVQ